MKAWSIRVVAARERLLRRGHTDPIVAVSTPDGRHSAGDPSVRCEIGSVTKVFTALLLTDLAAAGALRLDDTVATFLPPGTQLADGVAVITLQELATHRSGLPRLPPGILVRSFSRKAMADPYADITEDRLIAGLASTKVRGTPGKRRLHYSNYGFGLLGYLLGRITGLGYEESLTRRVLVPLGLTATSFTDDALHQGHYRRKPVHPWHLAALAGAGGLRSTADDLLTFLDAIRDGGGPLAESITETVRPRPGTGRVRTGLGWMILGDGDLLMHDGGTLGTRSEVRVERHTGVAVVVLGDGRRGTARAAGMLLSPRRQR